MPVIITNSVPYIKVPDTPDLRPGVRDFVFSFKFKLALDSAILPSLLPGNYGPFVGFHKQVYYINKGDDGVLRLVCHSGYMSQSIMRWFRRSEIATWLNASAFPGLIIPFTAIISPNTTYTVTFTKASTPRTSNSTTLTLDVSTVGSTQQTAYGRDRQLYPSTSGYAIFAGIFDTPFVFPNDIGPISLTVDDINLSMQQYTYGLKYRMRIDSYVDAKAYAEAPIITPTIAGPPLLLDYY